MVVCTMSLLEAAMQLSVSGAPPEHDEDCEQAPRGFREGSLQGFELGFWSLGVSGFWEKFRV